MMYWRATTRGYVHRSPEMTIDIAAGRFVVVWRGLRHSIRVNLPGKTVKEIRAEVEGAFK